MVTVCAPDGQHTPEKVWPAAVVSVEQGSLQQPLTWVGSEPASRQVKVWLQHALPELGSGSSAWQPPGGQQSLTAGFSRLGHTELGEGQSTQVPAVVQVVPDLQQVLAPVVGLMQTWLSGQHSPLTHCVPCWQQMLPQMPSLGQQRVIGLGPLVGRQVSQQATLVGSVPGHTGHTV